MTTAPFPHAVLAHDVSGMTPSLLFTNSPYVAPWLYNTGSNYAGFTPATVTSRVCPTGSLVPISAVAGFPPVSQKLVSDIVSGEFIEFAALLDGQPESLGSSIIADELVLRPRRRQQEIHDILSWMRAFPFTCWF